MRETFTSGSVGRAPGNRCLYPEPDRLQPPLVPRFGFRRQVSASVRHEFHWSGKEEGGEAKSKVQDGKVMGGVDGQPATNLASSTLCWSMSRQLNGTGWYHETQDDVSTT